MYVMKRVSSTENSAFAVSDYCAMIRVNAEK